MNANIIRYEKKKGIKLAVSITAAIFLVILYILIFSFSEQNGAESGSFSHEITTRIVETLDRIANKGWDESLKESYIAYWEHPIRKLAHFSEYAVMAVLVFLIFMPWMEWKLKLYGMIIVWVFLSASFDETHQLFIDGRCGSFWDVLLDTFGGAFGAMLAFGFAGIVKKCSVGSLKWNRKKHI